MLLAEAAPRSRFDNEPISISREAQSGVRSSARGTWCLMALAALCFLPNGLLAGAPTLSHLFPAGGQRGTKVHVTCTGKFSWPIKVWAPGLDVAISKEPGKIEVAIPRDLPADRVWLRLYNHEGASDLTPFLIGNLKETFEKEPNDKLDNAQPIADPHVTINGALNGADVDGFAVSLAAGQTLVAAVDANTRLGSPMDAILQVVSSTGIVLAENHDDLGLDPRLAFTPVKSGTYIVRLFAFPSSPDTEIRFIGRPNCVYRLTLTTGPYITHAAPLSVPRANPGTVEVLGWNVPPNTRLPVVPWGGPRLAELREVEVLDELRISPDASSGIAFSALFAGAAKVRLASHATIPGIAETNPQTPMMLTPPNAVTGWLRSHRQADVYRIPLKKGEKVVVSVESQSMYFPLDPVLKMTDSAGSVVAEVDDVARTRDAAIVHVAGKNGFYHVIVSDRYRQGGPRCFYRLTARLEEPDFELSTAIDALVVTPGKPNELAIKVQRHSPPTGPVGPITIQALGLPPGVTASISVSEPTGPSAENVTLNFSSTGPAFSGPFRIVGKARRPKVLEHFARTPQKLGAAFASLWLTALEKK